MTHSAVEPQLRSALLELALAEVPVAEVPPRLLDLVLPVLGADSGALLIFDTDSRRLVVIAARGLPRETLDYRLTNDVGAAGWVSLHGRPLLLSDASRDPRFFPLGQHRGCEMAVPLTENGAPIGVLSVQSSRAHRWKREDLQLFEAICAVVSEVLSRVWGLERWKRQAAQFETLAGIGQRLAAKHELGELLAFITAETGKLLGCASSALYLYDPSTQTLRLRSVGPDHNPLSLPEVLAMDATAVGTSVSRRKIIEITDLAKTEEWFAINAGYKADASLLCAPVVFESECLGALIALTDSTHRFSNDERKLLTTLAGQSAVVITNARLYTRVFEQEETLRRTDKLTTLGLLAAEIAHEIRNPLLVLKLLFESLDLKFPDGDPRQEDVRIMTDKMHQLEEIVTRVLNFGRAQAGAHEKTDLRDVTDDALRLVRLKLAQQKISVNYLRNSVELPIQAHRGQLQQVLLNLILNAAQAMPKGGALTVSTCIEKEEYGADKVLLKIADTGPGIPPETRERIFERLFTSRPDGTGLGLAISERIMKAHHGDLRLVSTGDGGTVMGVIIPLA